MTLLNYLQNLNGSQLATLLLWALVLILLVIGVALLLTFVKSWIAEKKSAKTSQLFQQTFENCLATVLTSLKAQLSKEKPSESSMIISQDSQDLLPHQEDPTLQQTDPTLQLVSDFISKIKEVYFK